MLSFPSMVRDSEPCPTPASKHLKAWLQCEPVTDAYLIFIGSTGASLPPDSFANLTLNSRVRSPAGPGGTSMQSVCWKTHGILMMRCHRSAGVHDLMTPPHHLGFVHVHRYMHMVSSPQLKGLSALGKPSIWPSLEPTHLSRKP